MSGVTLRTRRLGGFSLLETLIGAILVSVVLLSVNQVMVYHQRAFRQARNRIVGEAIIQGELERVIAVGFAGLPDIASLAPEVIQVKRRVSGTSVITSYEVDITMHSNRSGTLRKAQVTVKFPEGRENEVVLSAEVDLFWSQ